MKMLITMAPFVFEDDPSGSSRIVPPLPLSFDRVSEGLRSPSTTPLLQLPIEILGLITKHACPTSLTSLALVSRDCRQLARSRQFSHVVLDYSDASLGLIARLQAEGQERAENGGFTLLPSLGACIRRISIVINSECMIKRHQIRINKTFFRLNQRTQVARLRSGYHSYVDKYMPTIESLFADSSLLPHLSHLDWCANAPIPTSFYNGFARSTLQHLRIVHAEMDEGLAVELPRELARQTWPLRSLELGLKAPTSKCGAPPAAADFSSSILRLCAPALETLKLSICDGDCIGSFVTDGLGPAPRFPCLRNLQLRGGDLLDASILDALLQDNIRSLDVDTEGTRLRSEYFRTRGPIPSLETFIWSSTDLNDTQSLDFLRANPQLSKLSLEYPAPNGLLTQQVLPLLATCFCGLKSLNLVWLEGDISDQAVQVLRSVRSLEQIRLGSEQDWHVDHGAVRHHLRCLPALEKLEFDQDCYRDAELWTVQEDTGITFEVVRFERRQHVLREAKLYADVMPGLVWMRIGEMPVRVAMLGSEKEVVFGMAREMESCPRFREGFFSET